MFFFSFSFGNINVVPRKINISLNESVKDRTRCPAIQGFVRSMPERTLCVDRPLFAALYITFFVPKSPLMTDICKNHHSFRHYSELFNIIKTNFFSHECICNLSTFYSFIAEDLQFLWNPTRKEVFEIFLQSLLTRLLLDEDPSYGCLGNTHE